MSSTIARPGAPGSDQPPATGDIHLGDCRDLLRRLAPDSVDLSFWSPPCHVGKAYEIGQSYEDWHDLLRETIALHHPVIKPGGFMVIDIADILAFPDPSLPRIQAQNVSRQRKVTREQVVAAHTAHPDLGRRELARLLGCSEQTVQRRLEGNNVRGGKYATQTRVHLVGGLVQELVLAAGFTIYDRRIWVKDAAWMNSDWHSGSYRAVDQFEYLFLCQKPGATVVDRSRLTPAEWTEWGSLAVWHVPSVRANDIHPAMFPVALAERVIRLLTAPGELVLDPFMGSGTTAIAAGSLGREWIGFEADPHYVEVARARIGAALMSSDEAG